MQNTSKSIAAVIIGLAVTCAPGTVRAWDGVATGVIKTMDSVPGAGNYDFRVTIDGIAGPWCGPGSANGWAAVHSNEPNFKGVQASLMLAFAMGKTVSLFLNRDANNYCKIGYATVYGG